MISSSGKSSALVVCFGSYAMVLLLCLLLYPLVQTDYPVLNAAILDLIGTILIFSVSRMFNNSSFYDPYWSVAPVPLLLYWAIVSGSSFSAREVIILLLAGAWGIRLTWNWIRRWQGFRDEDWRYRDFRMKYGRTYWPVSFLGIHLFPTVIVFLGCLSAYPAIAFKQPLLDGFDILALLVTVTAIVIETISDEQLRRFLKAPGKEPFLSTGLWRYSRHPNYFGEVLFWTGLFLFSVGTIPFCWWALAGPLSMILLFNFISVPMIDRRMLIRKPGFERYMQSTPAWIFFARKRSVADTPEKQLKL